MTFGRARDLFARIRTRTLASRGTPAVRSPSGGACPWRSIARPGYLAPVWPHDLKLQRAREHLAGIKARTDRWRDADGYTTTVRADAKPPHFRIQAIIHDHVDGDDCLPLLIGDFLQNARAALDYMAFELGNVGAGGWMDDETAVQSGFPIVGDLDKGGFSGRGPDLFAQAAAARLKMAPEAARAVVEELQPYYVGGSVWMHEPLWILHELARYDRHRFFQPAFIQTGVVELDPATSRNVKIEQLEFEAGRLIEDPEEEGGTTIAHVTAHPADPNRPMQMHFRRALHLGWDIDSLPPTIIDIEDSPIDHTLALIEMKVRHALGRLSRFLPSHPPY